MGDYDKLSAIDGYTYVQAVRRSGRNTRGPRLRASRAKLPAGEKKQEFNKKKSTPGGRIVHTVMPDKFEIVCYECSYTFSLQGHIHDTMCPKCHKPLQMTDHIVEGKLSETIKTIGTIEIKREAVLNGGNLIARDIILAGDASEGTLCACRLVLCPGAKFDIKKVRMKDLRVRSKGRFTIRRKIGCRNLEVEGRLNARIYSDGIVTVKPGGLLQGEIHGPHLIVEEGGGLKAKVVVGIESQRSEDSRRRPKGYGAQGGQLARLSLGEGGRTVADAQRAMAPKEVSLSAEASTLRSKATAEDGSAKAGGQRSEVRKQRTRLPPTSREGGQAEGKGKRKGRR